MSEENIFDVFKEEESNEETVEEGGESEEEKTIGVFDSREEVESYIDAKLGISSREYEGEGGLVTYFFEVQSVIREISLKMLGYKIKPVNKGGRTVFYLVKTKDGLISEEGMTKLLSFLIPYVNKSNLMSYLKPREVYEKTLNFADTLFFFLLTDGVLKYGVDITKVSQIVKVLSDFVSMFLRRAEYGSEAFRILNRLNITIDTSLELGGKKGSEKLGDVIRKLSETFGGR